MVNKGERQDNKRFVIYVDGASRGNPGPAAIGFLILDERGTAMTEVSRAIGVCTNNHAEYQALIAGLEEAAKLDASHLEIRLDSELVARQLSGQYRVKDKQLKPLYAKAMCLLSRLNSFTIRHIRREHNRKADALANRALDKPQCHS